MKRFALPPPKQSYWEVQKGKTADGPLEPCFEFSFEERAAKYPHAHKNFKELLSAAKSTLNLELIQAEVSVKNLDTIERLNDLIASAQRRIDNARRS